MAGRFKAWAIALGILLIYLGISTVSSFKIDAPVVGVWEIFTGFLVMFQI